MQRNLTLLNVYTLFCNLVFILPIIVPFYRDEIGLSFNDFLIGEAVFAAVVIILDVPSGWIADVWGRRVTLLCASITAFIGYAWILHADTLWQTIVGQGIIGVAVSFNSGTISAMLYDSLLSEGREHEYRKREGFRHGLGLYGVAFGSLCGGIAYQYDHFLPFYLELICFIGAFITAWLTQEPARHIRPLEKHPLRDMVDTMKYALHGHKDIGVLIGFCALIFGSTKLFLWAQQPYYHALHIPESVYGFLLAIAMLAGGIGGHFGHTLWRNWQGLAVVKGLLAFVVVICLSAGLALTHGGFAILMLGALIWGFGWPRIQETINHAVGSERRATILSTASLMISLTFIPASLMLGWINDHAGITAALLVHGATIAVIGAALIVWLNWRDERASSSDLS